MPILTIEIECRMCSWSEPTRDFDHQSQIAADEIPQGCFVATIPPRESEFLLSLRAQHREPLGIGQ